jgi:hypothetical protein
VAADYLTLAALKATLSMSGETYADADLTVAITAASRAIDEYTGRFFYKDSSDATRKYTPVAGDYLYIDDLSAAPTSVTVNGTALVLNTDYSLGDANALLDGWPYQCLRSLAVSTLFPVNDVDSVVVVGKFGWPAVPSQIVAATSSQAARLMRRMREGAQGLVGYGFDGGGGSLPVVDPDLKLMLSPYRVRYE